MPRSDLDDKAEQERRSTRLQEYIARLAAARQRDRVEYDRLFDHAPEGIGLHEIDLDRVLRRVNGRELEILRYSRDQMLGHPVVDFVVMSEVSKRAIADKLSGKRELKPFVRTYRRGDGSAVPLIIVDSYIFDAKGEVAGICSAVTESALAF